MNIDNRRARRLMERMGIEMKEIKGVKEVIIVTNEKEIKIKNPSVSEINAQGARIFQVVGDIFEENKQTKFSEDDILLVQQQAKVSREKAINALEQSNGEVAKAILLLSTQG